MTTPDNQPASTSPAAPGNNDGERAALQRQLNTLLIALLVLSGTVAVFFWRTTRYIRQDLGALKPSAGAVMQAYAQEKQGVDAFIAKVAEYARTHPDFAPLAQKYQLKIPTNAPAAVPAAKSAPAPAPTQKK